MQLEIESIPVDEHLIEIYGRLPDETLVAEQERLRAAYAEIGGKIIALSRIREASQSGQYTLFN